MVRPSTGTHPAGDPERVSTLAVHEQVDRVLEPDPQRKGDERHHEGGHTERTTTRSAYAASTSPESRA